MADLGTSWGGYEQTPLYRSSDGTFGAKGAALKVAFTATMALGVWLYNRSTPDSPQKRRVQRWTSVGLAVIGSRNCRQAWENRNYR